LSAKVKRDCGQEYAGSPTSEGRHSGSVQFRQRKFQQHLTALDHPVPTGVSDDGRRNDDAHSAGQSASKQERQQGERHRENGELPNLDPDIEGEKRDQKVVAGELEVLLQTVREAEAVDQAE